MPTFVHGKNAKVLVGAYDLSTAFKEFTGSTSIDMAETSAFGNSYKTYIQGLGDSTLSLTGMWATGSAGEVDDVLGGLIGNGATLPVTVCPNGFGVGKKGFGIGSNESSYEITGSIGDVVGISAEFQSTVNTGGKSGVLQFPGTSIAATGAQTGVDGVAATTGGGYALLHVTANTRSTTSVVIVEDSADNVSWATIGTFATIGIGALTAEYLPISGNIRRYTRVTITLTAGSGAITPHVLLSRL